MTSPTIPQDAELVKYNADAIAVWPGVVPTLNRGVGVPSITTLQLLVQLYSLHFAMTRPASSSLTNVQLVIQGLYVSCKS